jgi:phospholipid-transporting ATPase
MIKDAFEDYKRAKSDKDENDALASVYDPKNRVMVDKTWKEIRCGNIIKLKDEQYCPADVVILKTSDSKGECYIETKNLDGETNLKLKNSNKEIMEMIGSKTE